MPASLLLAGGLAVTAAVSWWQGPYFPNQNLEANFQAAIVTGESQDGTTTKSGQEVGILSERAMAEYIEGLEPATGSIITDNADTFGVMLLTGRPEWFFDRVDEGDMAWLAAVDNPPASVQYYLVNRNSLTDQILEAYPDMLAGDPAFEPVYDNGRYALFAVTDILRARQAAIAEGGAESPDVQTDPEQDNPEEQ